MSEIPVDLYTLLSFNDGDEHHRVYVGERFSRGMGEEQLDGFEIGLKDFGRNYRRVQLVTEDSEVLAGLAFSGDWLHRPLSELLEDAKERGADVIHLGGNFDELTVEPEVRSVTYFGFNPSLSSILTDAKFAETLEKYGYSLADEEGEPIDYSHVTAGSVWVYDPGTETGIAVIHDGLIEAQLTSPGFEEILRVMDSFAKQNADVRLFLAAEEDEIHEVYADSKEFDWEFDVQSGRYLEPFSL